MENIYTAYEQVDEIPKDCEIVYGVENETTKFKNKVAISLHGVIDSCAGNDLLRKQFF